MAEAVTTTTREKGRAERSAASSPAGPFPCGECAKQGGCSRLLTRNTHFTTTSPIRRKRVVLLVAGSMFSPPSA